MREKVDFEKEYGPREEMPGGDEETTAVVFRKWPESEGGDVLALFPAELAVRGSYLIGSYESMGGHGSADYQGCIQRTRPATPEEYAELKEELERIGYKLKVYERGAHLLPWRNR